MPPRGLAAAYVPLAGLWAFAAGVLVGARKYVTERFGGSERARLAAQAALFCAVLGSLGWIHTANFNPSWVTGEEDEIMAITRQLGALHLALAQGSHVLMVNDPFRERSWGEWSSFFLMRLFYDDPALELEQCARPGPEAAGGYAAVLSYESGRLVRVDGCQGRSCCGEGGRK